MCMHIIHVHVYNVQVESHDQFRSGWWGGREGGIEHTASYMATCTEITCMYMYMLIQPDTGTPEKDFAS